MGSVLDSGNPVFAAYAFYAGVVIMKMLLMAILTARQRIRKSAFANPEDGKVNLSDSDVERVRRAHLNDLENIPPFLFLGLVYIFTDPAYYTALTCFRVFVWSRILHTFVYCVMPLPQPARGLSFLAGIAVNVYMGLKIITHFM